MKKSCATFCKLLSPLALVLLLMATACGGNSTDSNPEGDQPTPPVVVEDTTPPPPPPPPPMTDYERTFLDSGLVNLQDLNPDILVELKYNTNDNFLDTAVYGGLSKAYMRPEAAEKLMKAQDALKERRPDYTLLVYDGARPRRVQYIMWDVLDIPFKRNYLANPDEGSIHNYGCAVDLSIADSTGTEIDMGTPFDFFGELAQPQLEAQMIASGELTQEQQDNRQLLRDVMTGAGFFGIRTEWWHFNAFPSKYVKAEFGIIE